MVFLMLILASPWLSIATTLLYLSELSWNPEHRNLSYMEYRNLVDNRCTIEPVDDRGIIDPVGAESIDWAEFPSHDGFQNFWRIKIAEKAGLRALRRLYKTLATRTDAEGVPCGVERSDPNGTSFLAIRPQMPVEFPDWWQIPEKLARKHAGCWELKCGKRSLGWYWAYDDRVGELYLWEWSEQHGGL